MEILEEKKKPSSPDFWGTRSLAVMVHRSTHGVNNFLYISFINLFIHIPIYVGTYMRKLNRTVGNVRIRRYNM